MKTEVKRTEQSVSRRWIVLAIVHYTVHRNGMDHGLKTVTLQLRSLYEVAAIPDYIDELENVDTDSEMSYTLISSMHIYDEMWPEDAINYSLFN